MDNNLTLEALVEGVIFAVGDDGIDIVDLANTLDKPTNVLLDVLNKLIVKYHSNNYAIELVKFGSVYKFLTKVSLYGCLDSVFNNGKEHQLSQSALETLIIIAYKQPIERSEIEEIRGVSCDHMIRKLLLRNLIQEAGRSNAPGKPFLYEVTDVFMDTFKLQDLLDLPALPSYVEDVNDSLLELGEINHD